MGDFADRFATWTFDVLGPMLLVLCTCAVWAIAILGLFIVLQVSALMVMGIADRLIKKGR